MMMSIVVVGGVGMGLFGPLGMLLMTLVWGGLVLLLVWGVRHFFPYERHSDDEVARDVLARRYAAGEMSEAEYQQALRTLRYD